MPYYHFEFNERTDEWDCFVNGVYEASMDTKQAAWFYCVSRLDQERKKQNEENQQYEQQ